MMVVVNQGQNVKILVTAGGQGTKLWPFTRADKPKQFQPIIGDVSSYELTINTLLKRHSPEDIFISTKRKFIGFISEQSPSIPLRNYIVEPDIARDRGPAEGLAFLKLDMMHPDEPFFLVQADNLREPDEKFLDMIDQANELVTKHKKLITGGFKAVEPSMGIDYLKLGEQIPAAEETYSIDEFLFRRKTLAETQELVRNFHVVVHSNHACWYPGLMLEAYKKHRPDWYDALMQIREVIDKPGENEAIDTIYAQMEKGPTEEVTINVMNSGEAMVILLPYKWTDVGTWGSVYDYHEQGGANHLEGDIITVDSTGSLVKTSNKNKLIAVAGVHDLIVIDTEDALLIVPKMDVDKIKDIQQILEEQNRTDYL